MRTRLACEEIERYRRDGFLYYPNFLDASEETELRQAMLDAISTMGKRKIAGKGANLMEGNSNYDRVFTQRINLHRISETVKRYMLARDLGQMQCQLEGVDALRVWHDQAFIKEPYANATTSPYGSRWKMPLLPTDACVFCPEAIKSRLMTISTLATI